MSVIRDGVFFLNLPQDGRRPRFGSWKPASPAEPLSGPVSRQAAPSLPASLGLIVRGPRNVGKPVGNGRPVTLADPRPSPPTSSPAPAPKVIGPISQPPDLLELLGGGKNKKDKSMEWIRTGNSHCTAVSLRGDGEGKQTVRSMGWEWGWGVGGHGFKSQVGPACCALEQ